MDWADEKAAELQANCGQYDEISVVDIAAALRCAHIAGLKEAAEIMMEVDIDLDSRIEAVDAINWRIDALSRNTEDK